MTHLTSFPGRAAANPFILSAGRLPAHKADLIRCIGQSRRNLANMQTISADLETPFSD
jgi:hypothetical protein